MTEGDRWDRVKELFYVALHRKPPERAVFLREACREEPSLQAEVESLLDAHQRAGDFAERSPLDGFTASGNSNVADPADSRRTALTRGDRFGPYQIAACLGVGGMGEVYRAHDPRLGRDVAIKILPHAVAADQKRLQRFEREARVLAALNHPHIGAIYGVEDVAGVRALVLELVEGQTLGDRLKRGAVRLPETLAIARQIADALVAAHDKGIVHRDLKPANIAITPSGVVKILDFGLAKTGDDSAPGRSRSPTITADDTQPGMLLGTAAYMSPEQARGQAVDKRADIWAFGCVLYELLTGRASFPGETTSDHVAAILSRDPDWTALPSDTPVKIRRLLQRCLEKDLSRRLRDIGDGSMEIDEAIIGGPESERAENIKASPYDVPTREMVLARSTRHRVGVTIAAISLTIIFGFVAYFVTHRSPSSSRTPLQFQVVQLTTSGDAEAPAISPDGRYVAFVRRDGDRYSLWLRQTATASELQIVASEPDRRIFGATITPDGNSIDLVRGPFPWALWRVPIIGGAPRKLIDRVSSLSGWSADGQQMAFVLRIQQTAPFTSSVVLTDSEGLNPQILATRREPESFLAFANNYIGRPIWSPDGKQIAVAAVESNNEGVIALLDSKTGTQDLIRIPDLNDYSGTAWLDGNTLVTAAERQDSRSFGTGFRQLWSVAVRDHRTERLSNDLSSYSHITATRDGETIAAIRTDTRSHVWISSDFGTSGEVGVPASVEHQERSLAWAGSRLLYTSSATGRAQLISVDVTNPTTARPIASDVDFPAGTTDGSAVYFSGVPGLMKSDADGRHVTTLVKDVVVSPSVTPDNQYLVFISQRTGLQSPWMVPIEGGEPVQLTKTLAAFPSVSPDMRTLLFRTADDVNNAVLITCEFPKCINPIRIVVPALLVHGLRGAAAAKWSPEGGAFVFANQSLPMNLWVQRLDGGSPRQLTHFTDAQIIDDFAWSRDGKRLAVSRSLTTNDIVLFKRSSASR